MVYWFPICDMYIIFKTIEIFPLSILNAPLSRKLQRAFNVQYKYTFFPFIYSFLGVHVYIICNCIVSVRFPLQQEKFVCLYNDNFLVHNGAFTTQIARRTGGFDNPYKNLYMQIFSIFILQGAHLFVFSSFQ